MTNSANRAKRPVSFFDLLRTPYFAGLFGAEMFSMAGDQLARIALSVLVFDRTGSAVATAATYASTLLPAVVGGFVLGGIGDRLDRRTTMIATDLLRALCFVAMALPAIPLPLALVLLIIAVFVGPAFSASQLSYLAGRLDAEQYRAASALRLIGSQTAQVGGFAIGGVLVVLLDPHGALGLNAATFLVSSLVVAIVVARDPASGLPAAARPRALRPSPGPTSSSSTAGPAVSGAVTPESGTPVRTVSPAAGLWASPHLRGLLVLSMLVGFFVVPEGLAVPFGHQMGATASQVGALLAAGALGGALGSVLLVRVVPPRMRVQVSVWMAVCCGLPLVVSGLTRQWLLVLLCWMISGALAAYLVEAVTVVIQAVPDARRAGTVGVVNALLLGAQGLGLLSFGAIAATVEAGHSVALSGAVGSALALALALGPLRRQAVGSPALGSSAV